MPLLRFKPLNDDGTFFSHSSEQKDSCSCILPNSVRVTKLLTAWKPTSHHHLRAEHSNNRILYIHLPKADGTLATRPPHPTSFPAPL